MPDLTGIYVHPNGHQDNGGVRESWRGGTNKVAQADPVFIADGSTYALTSSGAGNVMFVPTALHTVSSSDIGNGIRVTGGTNATVGWYVVASVNTGNNSFTLNGNWCTGAVSNGAGRFGGALTIPSALLVNSANHPVRVWVKSGSYTISAATSTAGNIKNLTGYYAEAGDTPTETQRPVIYVTGSSYTAFNGTVQSVFHINFDGTGSSGVTCINQNYLSVHYCSFSGFGTGIQSSDTRYGEVGNCRFMSCGTGVSGVGRVISCTFSNCGTAVNGCVLVVHCVAYNCTTPFNAGWTGSFVNCTAYNSSGSAFRSGTTSRVITVQNCIADGATYAIEWYPYANSVEVYRTAVSVAYRNCSSGFTNNPPNLSSNIIVLTQTPFVDAAGGDFRLNDLPGGGALCRAAGIGPVGQQSALDIGAVQTAADSRIFVFEDD